APNLARLDQTIGGLDGPGFAIAAGDEAGLVAAGCERGGIMLWHKDVAMGVRAGDGSADVLRGHQGPVLALAYNGGPLLASAGADQKVILWELPAGKPVSTLTPGTLTRALAMALDGKLLAGGGDDAAVQLWEVATGKPVARLAAHTDWVLAL